MTLLEIVRKALEDMGADGLCNPEYECGCSLDDLAPCMETFHIRECQPARKGKPPAEMIESGEAYENDDWFYPLALDPGKEKA